MVHYLLLQGRWCNASNKRTYKYLRIIGRKKIIVALTKIDLVDKEWIELVELEFEIDNSSIRDYNINKVSVINMGMKN